MRAVQPPTTLRSRFELTQGRGGDAARLRGERMRSNVVTRPDLGQVDDRNHGPNPGRDGTTGTERLATTTYALTAEDIDLGSQAARTSSRRTCSAASASEPSARAGGPSSWASGPSAMSMPTCAEWPGAELDDLDPPQYRMSRRGASSGRRRLSGSGSRRRRVRGARRFPGTSRVETGASSR